MRAKTTTFAQLGEVFDDATTRLVGGVSPGNQAAILKDLTTVQNGIERLLASNPDDFQGVAGIHAQNVIDQLNLERSAIQSVGTDPFAAKYINDVHRDLIDIVQGDEQLAALAAHGGTTGFAPVPDLLVAPAPFVGSAEQTAFMQTFVTTTQDFAERAVALADGNGSAADIEALVGEVQAFDQAANEFTKEQGGLYSARFDNEFADNGVNGTASRALIDGLQAGNADKVHAAAEVLTANAEDVATNMLPNGSAPENNGNGIPAAIESLAEAGAVFNDATTKLIGGVYEGNRQSIHDDLAATRAGLVELIGEGKFSDAATPHVNKAVDLIDSELKIVDDPNAGAQAAKQINALHSQVIGVIQGDAELAAAANEDGANGFMQLPGLLKGNGMHVANGDGHGNGHGHGNGGQGGGQGNGHGGGGSGNGHAGGHGCQGEAAVAAMADPAATDDPMAHIFAGGSHHHIG